MTIRVVIVDDHEIVRQGLRTLLEPEPDLEVVGEAATGGEALSTCGRLHPDVVLLDLRLPDIDGVEVCRMLRERDTGIHVLALTTFDEPDLVDRCIQAGVTGYVVKDVEQFEPVDTSGPVIRRLLTSCVQYFHARRGAQWRRRDRIRTLV